MSPHFDDWPSIDFWGILSELHDGLAVVDDRGRITPLDEKANSVFAPGARFETGKEAIDSARTSGELKIDISLPSSKALLTYKVRIVRASWPSQEAQAFLLFKRVDDLDKGGVLASDDTASSRRAISGSIDLPNRLLEALIAISSAGDLRELLDALLGCACESIGVEMAAICLFDESGENLIVIANYGLNLPSGRVAIPFSNIVKRSLLSCDDLFERTFYVDHRPDFPYAEELDRAGIKSISVSPLMGRDGAIGFCALLSPSKREFSSREFSLVKSLGERLGAIVRARPPWWKMLADADFLGGVRVAAAAIAAEDFRILSANSIFKSLFGIAEGASARDAVRPFEALDLTEAIAHVVESGETRTYSGCKSAVGPWVNTYWTVLLAVDKLSPSGKASTIALFAVEVTPEVEAEKLTERYAAQLASAQRMGIALSSETDLQSLLEKMAYAAAELVGAENSAIALEVDGEWEWVAVHAQDESKGFWSRSAVWRPIKRGTACAKLLKRRTPARQTAPLTCDPMRRAEPHPKMAAFLSVPLIGLSDEVIGQIILGGKRGDYAFSEADESAMVIFAAQAASLIQRVRELEREKGTVEILSEALAPKVPRIEGVNVDVVYRPSGATGVCGDFLDFIELGEGRIGIVLGDVCGRGVEGATLAVMARHVIRTFACEEINPAAVLKRANKVIKAQLPLGRFVTAFYGVLDPKTGFLRYAIAGHPPPFIFNRRTGDVRLFDFGSIPLGIFEDEEFAEPSLKLTPDDVLVVYTDGLSEARRGLAFFGEARMFEVVKKYGSCWSRIAESLVDEAIRFSGGMDDDIAVVALSLSGD